MMHRDQLGWNHAAQIGAALDVVGLCNAALQRLLAQRARILLEAPDHPRQLTQLLVARETASEFEALAGRHPAALAELATERMAILGRLIDFPGEFGSAKFHPLELREVAVLDVVFDLARFLIE